MVAEGEGWWPKDDLGVWEHYTGWTNRMVLPKGMGTEFYIL